MPSSEAELNNYDVVIADFCSSLGTQGAGYIRDYVHAGGSTIILGDMCGTAEGDARDIATFLTKEWGITFGTQDNTSVQEFYSISPHPITGGVKKIAGCCSFLQVSQPSQTLVSQGKYDFLAFYDGQGTVVAISGALFYTNWRGLDNDNFVLWQNTIGWLIQKAHEKR